MKTGVAATDDKLRICLLLTGRVLMGNDLRVEYAVDIFFQNDVVCMFAGKCRVTKAPSFIHCQTGQTFKLFSPLGHIGCGE